MAIKLREDIKRTEVRPAFWAALSAIGRAALAEKVRRIQSMQPNARRRSLEQSLPEFQTIKTAVERNEAKLTHIIHSGWEYISGEYAFGEHWLVFALNDVVCAPVRRRNSHASYYLDDYIVYVPQEAFVLVDLSRIHFIPQYDPLTVNRHPHHRVWRSEHDLEKDPLEWQPSTCWGGYDKWIRTALSKWHVLDLMLGLKKFLTHWTPGDTLIPVNSNTFPRLRAVDEQNIY